MSFPPAARKDFTSFRMAKRLKPSPHDPFAFSNLVEKGDCSGMFGSVTKDIMDLIERKNQAVKFLLAQIEGRKDTPSEGIGETEEKNVVAAHGKAKHVVIIDSDDEEGVIEHASKSQGFVPFLACFERVELKESKSQGVMTQEVELGAKNEKGVDVGAVTQPLELGAKKEKYVYVDVEKDKKSSTIEGIPKEDQKNVTKSGVVKDVVIIESDDEQERDCRPVEQNPRELMGVKPTESKSQGVVPFLACSQGVEHAQSNSQGVVTQAVEVEAKNEKGICIGEVTQPLEQEAKNKKGMFLGLAVQSVQPCAKNDKGVSVEVVSQPSKLEAKKGKGVYVGVDEDDDDETENEDGALGDIWTEMSLALECSKDAEEDVSIDEQMQVGDDYCDHSFVLKDDLGYVCRICGLIERRIETIIDVQFNKAKRSTRTYMSSYRSAQDQDSNKMLRVELTKEDLMTTDLAAHPRHIKQMKPHQVAGFNFLCSNLVADNPGGCILAHAPGSGKTFMIISFLQSFLAKYPHSRPLIVMPKGILPTWKKEFQTWQVEDVPLYDFYSVKADSRLQQLEVLRQWAEEKSILLLGYKQFTSIVCDDANENNNATASCQEILLKQPSILILDEGHTPRNEDTEVLQSLVRVQTPRKVVLSGTLYQNHVKEVFNILNLVRPKFLRLDASRAIVRRIMSRVDIASAKKSFKAGSDQPFYDLVEHTIQKDKDFKRKVTVIQDLREMTSKVLHYYRGDFLDELPGLVDFTVVLNLSSWQKKEVHEIKKLAKFKRCSVGSAIYLHPKLKSFSEGSALKDDRMDELLENLDLVDGVKAKFFLCVLGLCESAKEKLLVFSQYLPPLKFLEKLTTKIKGWVLGREMFMISGESSSDHREWSMEQFNKSNDAKVFFGSIKACGEGISLVGASRVIILDVHLNPSVTRQAIGRAFRPGQKKKVYVYRLVAADSPEEEDHSTCFRKEVTAKMWFEWNEHSGYRKFEVETVDLKDCNDSFLESPLLREDVTALYRR